MNAAQHLIIAARTRLIPIEIFARGRWVVVEMTDDRNAIDRKFKALQRFAQLHKGVKQSATEIVVFASQKSDIGVVSVVGLHNAAAAPKLATIFATGREVRHAFWKNVFTALREEFDPPVASYDAIAAERLFISETAKSRKASRRITWVRIQMLGAAIAALILIGFSGAWLIENFGGQRAAVFSQNQTAEDGADPVRDTTKSERLSGLASYFGSKDD